MCLHFSECPTAMVIQHTALEAFTFADTCCPFSVSRRDVSGTQEVLNNIRVTAEETRHLQKVYRKKYMQEKLHQLLMSHYSRRTNNKQNSDLEMQNKTHQLFLSGRNPHRIIGVTLMRSEIFYLFTKRPKSADFFFTWVWSDMKGSTVWESGPSNLVSYTLFSVSRSCGVQCLSKVAWFKATVCFLWHLK